MKALARRIAFAAMVATIAFYAAFPFAWAIISSLNSGSDLFSPSVSPSRWTIANYRDLFQEQPFLRNIINSLIVAGVSTAISLLAALFAAYSLARIRFAGRTAILYCVLGVSMFPQVALLAGMYETVRLLGLYNTLTGLIFANLALLLPFTTWVMTSFMRDLSVELEDAAVIDGAGPLRIVLTILAPIMAPAITAAGLIAFILAWNEFLFALTFTLSPERRTVPVAIALISGATAYELPWGRIMAASVIVTAPLICLVLALQNRIVAGLTAGAVKG